METETASEANQASNFSIHSSNKHLKCFDFYYSIIHYNFPKSCDISFPSVGYVILGFMIGDNFQQSSLNIDRQDVKAGYLYISGLLSGEPVISRHQGEGYLHAIKLHPVIAYHLLKERMNYTTDRHTPFTDIIGKRGMLLRRMETDQQIFSFDHHGLTAFLLKHLPEWYTIQHDPIFHAVNAIIRSKGIIRIKKLAAQFCMSERTLHRQFLLKVGLSPKAYAKIWQWQYVMELLQSQPHISLQELAFKAGYYDAAHLEHDFKEKVLQTPSQFRQNINPLLEDYLNFPGSLG